MSPEFQLFIGNKCFSSWSLRPWVALRHFGIPFAETVIRLRTPETAANLARISPTGQVPVLLHRKTVVWETLAILEYLAELFPDGRLWPKDRATRRLARCAATEMHAGFLELRYAWPMNLRRPKGHRPLDGVAAAQARRVEAIWRQCRGARSPTGPFLFGHFTIADAMYSPMVTRFDTYGGTLDDDIRAYVDAVLATPAMRQWYAEAAEEPWPEPAPDE
jgi:glutathione S-transferase